MYIEFKQFLKRFRFLIPMVRGLKFLVQEYRRIVWHIVRPRATKTYLKSHQIRKLQIGAKGNVLKGWLNTDLYPIDSEVVFLDATKPFPFEDGTFDYIFCEHIIEHLTYTKGVLMLHECYRVLKPNGKIRIATPSFENLIGLYAPEKNDLQRRYIQWTMDQFLPDIGVPNEVFVINNALRGWGHQFVYDRATLQNALEEVAFVDVVCYAPGESDDKNLRCLESHGKAIGDEDMNRFETLVIEAKRPI